MDVTVNPRVGIDPEIDEWSSSSFWSGLAFGERLRMIQTFVATEIAPYEYDCTGYSRMEDLVIEEVQDLMDDRRGITNAPRRVRPAVAWRPADARDYRRVSGSFGQDFPPDGPGAVDAGPRGTRP